MQLVEERSALSPLIIILFVLTFVIFIIGGWAAFTLSKPQDEEYGESKLTKNQIRLIGWGVAILIALMAAVIEYFIVID